MTIDTSSWNNYSFIKKGAIALSVGAAAGVLGYYSATYVAQACSSSKGSLSDYLCLRSGKFFEPANLQTVMNPIIRLTDSVKRAVLPLTFFIPDISLQSPQCAELATSLRELFMNKKALEVATDLTVSIYEPCCKRTSSVREGLAKSFGEEFIYRFMIQGVLFAALQKLPNLLKLRGRARPIQKNTPPSQFQKIVSNPYARILTISLIFAFGHFRSQVVDDQVLPNFISSVIYGSLLEKYGLLYGTLAATSAHFVHNIFAYTAWKNQCLETVGESLAILKLFKE